ncbi:MBL fold metallo-hydrolase [Promicromonospora thailandica]|uniref:L-ascorbate metabolism protein UlaG, beta-lactamase superfamily n=1 Tax=Promicromonospora thailandica TaxID=765201 RepID=A0A9X2GCE3_9MICO|nr:MBL fold metallo-hydrolase [Promicromonospora thailandica]MCP2266591.1 L-ascorbate metabolism protein UlaG, beta-lactamase superfamily [Promicromonospora thailandica]BFF17334.1 MBL fold metallo-hydrolase [Promicromonospora thailandica]
MFATSSASGHVPVRVLGGPTAVLEYGGLCLLTDPTFDAPGEYPSPGRPVLVKTAPSDLGPADVLPVDVVLLSHDEHPDNLDVAGRALLTDVPLTLTTPAGAQRLGGAARGLTDWETVELGRPDGGQVTVTGVPAVHGPGPRDLIEAGLGQVVGFVLTGDGLPTVYVSGDNASLDLVTAVADRFGPVDTAVLHVGAPRLPVVLDGAAIVLTSVQAVEAARILGARRVVPAHYDGWAHFSEGREDVIAAFTAAGLSDLLDLAGH